MKVSYINYNTEFRKLWMNLDIKELSLILLIYMIVNPFLNTQCNRFTSDSIKI